MAKVSALFLGLGKKKPGAEEDPMDEPIESEDDGSEDAAHDDAAVALADAVKGGDAKAIRDAFKTMYDLCASGGGYEEDDADED